MKKLPIYDILKREHEEVTELFAQLHEAKGAKATDLLIQIKLKLVPHSRAEEAVFYSRLLKEKLTGEKVREALEEHKQVDVLLTELEALPTRDANWSAKAHVLADMVGHHVDEEEGEMFPLVRQILSEKEALRVGEEFEEERDRVRQELMRPEQRGAA